MYIDIFLETIEDYLLKNNLTINQLASRLGICTSTMTRWQNHHSLPSIKDVKIIAKYLGLSCDYMFALCDTCIMHDFVDRPFATKLAERIAEANITAYQLAKDCNFQRAAVSKWLNGSREPRIHNVIEIACYFGCSIDSLI